MTLKNIHSPADLAIHGAAPAFNEPLHVGRPNMGDKHAFLERVSDIFDRKWLTNNGPVVQEFEHRIANHLGVKHCIAICNGTIALEIAIRALGMQGEVIVPSYTFIATAHALHWQGIKPVFADIDPSTHNLDPSAVERMITPQTSGIIGVHLWGRPAAVDALQALADKHDLKLMFDAAHAFGCKHRGTSIGNFGACEVFSFHATKVFNTFEGGAIATNDDALADTIRLMRNFGFAGYDDVIHPGTNGKMPEINAAMGLINLDALPTFIDANRCNYLAYARNLADIKGLHLITHPSDSEPNYHYIVLEVSDDFPASRDEIVEALQKENILARKYFWPGCHRMKPYCDLFPENANELDMTEHVADRVFVLPSGNLLNQDIVSTIVDILRAMAQGIRPGHI